MFYFSSSKAPLPLSCKNLQLLSDACHLPSASPVILCIGTDRIIGDALGPITGSLLARTSNACLTVYGTLQQTVHALNLPEICAEIKKKHPGRAVLAIDASFGAPEAVGSVFLRPGRLSPGAGVAKKLPEVGDLSITGIVGCSGANPYLALQSVRLSLISQMAEHICRCLLEAYALSCRSPW